MSKLNIPFHIDFGGEEKKIENFTNPTYKKIEKHLKEYLTLEKLQEIVGDGFEMHYIDIIYLD